MISTRGRHGLPEGRRLPDPAHVETYWGMTRAFFEGMTLEDLALGRPITPMPSAGQQSAGKRGTPAAG